MFDYNFVENPFILIGFVIAILAGYLVKRHKQYADLFVHPRQMWLKGKFNRKKILVVGIVLFLMLLIFPRFEALLSQVAEPPTTPEYGQTEVTVVVARHIGLNYAYLIIGIITFFGSLFEVLVFRGIFLDFFAGKTGKVIGVLIVSVLFGLYHLAGSGTNLTLFPLTFAASIVFSLVWFYGGVLSCWGVHGSYNLVVNILAIF